MIRYIVVKNNKNGKALPIKALRYIYPNRFSLNGRVTLTTYGNIDAVLVDAMLFTSLEDAVDQMCYYVSCHKSYKPNDFSVKEISFSADMKTVPSEVTDSLLRKVRL